MMCCFKMGYRVQYLWFSRESVAIHVASLVCGGATQYVVSGYALQANWDCDSILCSAGC